MIRKLSFTLALFVLATGPVVAATGDGELMGNAPREVASPLRVALNWDEISGNWKQFTGKARQKWGKLTDDDLEVAKGRRIELIGKLQERYGISKEEASQQVDSWFKSLEP